jgi:uncharacterized protein (TIGR02145 family)
MKYFTLIQHAIVFMLLLTMGIACKKNPSEQPTPHTTNTVTIGRQEYPTVQIGNQVWTTVNYSGQGGVAYGTGNEKVEYGRYYTFDEVTAIALPDGWRIPTVEDYLTLARKQGVRFTNNRAMGQEATRKLLSKTNWRSVAGTNASGFNAQPAGYCFQNEKPADGDIAEFWTKEGYTISIQESATTTSHNILFYDNNDSAVYRFNLRLVSDQ